MEDRFAQLARGKSFTKLDLNQAYQQLPLSEESMQNVVINTQKGLFLYTKLPYGISSSLGILQIHGKSPKGDPRGSCVFG